MAGPEIKSGQNSYRCPGCGSSGNVSPGYCSSCSRKQSSSSSSGGSTSTGGTGEMQWYMPRWMKIALVVIIAAVALFFFSKTALFNQIIGNNMEALRLSGFSTIKDKGTEIDAAGIAANKTALDAYIASGESYRMSGTFEFGYIGSGGTITTFSADVKMSYNAELDAYKFTVKNKEKQGYNALGDEKLKPFHIADGTYYIVTEGDKTYVLSDVGGEKKVEDVTGGKGSYVFLTMYRMQGNVDTDFMSGGATASTAYSYHLWDGDYYHRTYTDAKYNLYVLKNELKTYKDKPVRYEHCGNIPNLDVGYKFTVDYYYNGIPKDAPSVADWK